MTVIVVLVAWFSFALICNYDEFNTQKSQSFFHSNALTINCTSLPALTLSNLASPSFTLLYLMDEISTPGILVKIMCHQWY